MQRLGKNRSGYCGDTIDVRAVVRDIELAAQQRGWRSEAFHTQGEYRWLALQRPALSPGDSTRSRCLYLSAGIHGDEPAGPLAVLRLLRENRWPPDAHLVICPCLNPAGFALNCRANSDGLDLNRDYRHFRSAEIRAHVQWLRARPEFSLALCLHEDWEAQGFYVYELNPEQRPSLAEAVVAAVARVCPIDPSPVIEGRPAVNGIIRPSLDPNTRPEWPEAFWLIQNKTRQSCTLEAPSDFPLATRVNALVAGVQAALGAGSPDPVPRVGDRV